MEKRLLVSNGKCSRLIDQDKILFFYMEQGRVTVYFYERNEVSDFTFYHSMKNIEARLPENSFVRVHRNYLISIDHLLMIDRMWVVMDDKNATKIPVGRTYGEKLKSVFDKAESSIIAL